MKKLVIATILVMFSSLAMSDGDRLWYATEKGPWVLTKYEVSHNIYMCHYQREVTTHGYTYIDYSVLAHFGGCIPPFY